MSIENNGNGKAMWATIGSVVVFIMLMVGLFGFFVAPLIERVSRLEKEEDEKTLMISASLTKITTLEAQVKFYREDTNEDNDKILERLESLEKQQGIAIVNSMKLLELVSKREKEKLSNE